MTQPDPAPPADLAPYAGLYVMSFLALDVAAGDGVLLAKMPGVPDGYEMHLSPAGEHAFRAGSGPLRGATVTFTLPEGDRAATALQIGPYTLGRAAALPDDALRLVPPPPPGTGADDEARSAAFDALMAQIAAGGAEIPYTLDYPLHEFLQYVTASDRYLFHGSNNTAIDEFVPVRRSVEMGDPTGRGNQAGVYATDDALWALFYAVVDRERLRGGMRNMAVVFHDGAGNPLHLYAFSLHHESLAAAPWTEGALYILPRDPFGQQSVAPGALTAEWVSLEPVRPLARLRVAPQQFPFLEHVQAHDDSALLRVGDLRRQWLASVQHAVSAPDRLTLTLDWDEETAAAVAAYVELQRGYMPAARYDLRPEGEEAQLIISGPPAYLHVLASSTGVKEERDNHA
ncbi:MAG: hypothetical protein R3272_10970 [Candidatus Promineifilaceae bacterium]|nr:hypothetical protein [Candidatus Promineifilaceae bacterium]